MDEGVIKICKRHGIDIATRLIDRKCSASVGYYAGRIIVAALTDVDTAPACSLVSAMVPSEPPDPVTLNTTEGLVEY